MKKKLLVIFIAIYFATFYQTSFAKTSIGITPSRLELSISKGKTYQKEITVFNQGTKPYAVKSYARRYISNGRSNLFGKLDQGWLKISPSSFKLKPHSSRKIKIKINIPEESEVKNQNIVVFFEPQINNGEISVAERVGTMLSLKIKEQKVFPWIYLIFYIFIITLIALLIALLLMKRFHIASLIKPVSVLTIITLISTAIIIVPVKKATANPGTKTKTVEFFIGQDSSTGIATATTKTYGTSPNNVTISLPDAISGTPIRSAWIEYNTVISAVDSSATQFQLGQQGQSLTTLSSPNVIDTTGESQPAFFRLDAKTVLDGFVSGAGSWNIEFSTQITGPMRYGENAKLFITYDYNDQASTQIKTVKYHIGAATAVMNTATPANFTLQALNLPEASVNIRSSFAETRGYVSAATPNPFSITTQWAGDSANSSSFNNTTNSYGFLILSNTASLNPSSPKNFTVSTPTANAAVSGVNSIITVTFEFNYDSSTELTESFETLLTQSTLTGSTAAITGTTPVSIPESTISVLDAYLEARAVQTNTAARTLAINAQMNSAPASATNVSFNANQGETDGFSTLTYDVKSNLSTLTTGNNTIGYRFNSSAVANIRGLRLILTYKYDKASTTDENEDAEFFIAQQTAASTTWSQGFTANVADNSPTFKVSHLDTSFNSNATGAISRTIGITTTAAYAFLTTTENTMGEVWRDTSSDANFGAYTATLNANYSSTKNATYRALWQSSTGATPSLTLTINETYDINGTPDTEAPFAIGFGTTDPINQTTYTVRSNNGQYAIQLTVQSNVKWELALEANDDLKDSGGHSIPIADLKTAEDSSGSWTSLVKTPSSFLIKDEEPSTGGTAYYYDYRLENIDLDVDAGVGNYENTITYSLLESTVPGAG